MDSSPPDIAHKYLDDNLSLDDFLLQQSVASYRFMVSLWHVRDKTSDESALYRLLCRGFLDVDPKLDSAYPTSIRAMRHTACVADRLWTLIERERIRVQWEI